MTDRRHKQVGIPWIRAPVGRNRATTGDTRGHQEMFRDFTGWTGETGHTTNGGQTEMTTVHNITTETIESGDVYIGRATDRLPIPVLGQTGYFGNPFVLANPRNKAQREAVIAQFEIYARERIGTDPIYRDRVKALHGKRLFCYCAPKACHGDVLAMLAAELQDVHSPEVPEESIDKEVPVEPKKTWQMIITAYRQNIEAKVGGAPNRLTRAQAEEAVAVILEHWQRSTTQEVVGKYPQWVSNQMIGVRKAYEMRCYDVTGIRAYLLEVFQIDALSSADPKQARLALALIDEKLRRDGISETMLDGDSRAYLAKMRTTLGGRLK